MSTGKVKKSKKKMEVELPMVDVDLLDEQPIEETKIEKEENSDWKKKIVKDIFQPRILISRVYLSPRDLHRDFEQILHQKLVKMYERKCHSEGYIQEGSVQIVERENGFLYGNQFLGDICFLVKFSVMICHPIDGSIIEGTIRNMNRLGILAENGPLSIIVARQMQDNKEIFDSLQIGEKVYVEVLRTRFHLNDRKIEVIGKYVSEQELQQRLEKKKAGVTWQPYQTWMKKKEKMEGGSTVLEEEDQQTMSEKDPEEEEEEEEPEEEEEEEENPEEEEVLEQVEDDDVDPFSTLEDDETALDSTSGPSKKTESEDESSDSDEDALTDGDDGDGGGENSSDEESEWD